MIKISKKLRIIHWSGKSWTIIACIWIFQLHHVWMIRISSVTGLIGWLVDTSRKFTKWSINQQHVHRTILFFIARWWLADVLPEPTGWLVGHFSWIDLVIPLASNTYTQDSCSSLCHDGRLMCSQCQRVGWSRISLSMAKGMPSPTKGLSKILFDHTLEFWLKV